MGMYWRREYNWLELNGNKMNFDTDVSVDAVIEVTLIFDVRILWVCLAVNTQKAKSLSWFIQKIYFIRFIVR